MWLVEWLRLVSPQLFDHFLTSSVTYLTNRLQIRSQMKSKCGKKKKVARLLSG